MIASTLFKELFWKPYKILTDPKWQKWTLLLCKFMLKKPTSRGFVNTESTRWQYIHAASFLSMYKNILVEEIYKLPDILKSEKTQILDIGANIGISSYYFAKYYPKSEVISLEPDPTIFKILKENLSNFNNIKLLNIALWTEVTALEFDATQDDGGRISTKKGNCIVQTETFKNIWEKNGPFSIVKIDIEGAENQTFKDLLPYTSQISHIFIEYHAKPSEKQKLGYIIDTLTQEGFRVAITPVISQKRPWHKIEIHHGFDTQLNIFGIRN